MNKQEIIFKQNLFVLAIAVFIAGIGFSEALPFLPLYIKTLGTFTHKELNFWVGFTFSTTYFVSALVSPWWGKLADQRGRKLMILRSSIGMAIAIGSMGFVTNVYQLFCLRMLQGFFAGFVSNANALIATESPKNQAGKAMGTMDASFTAGNLLGPLLGGLLASMFTYHFTFLLTGILLFISFILSFLFVKEEFKPISKQSVITNKQVINSLKSSNLIFGLLLTTIIIQTANSSINPIVALYVANLMHNQGNTIFVAGIIAALPGIATFLAAPRFGELGDKIGTHKIIIGGLISAIIFFFATAFVTNAVQLGFLRFLIGFSDACLFSQVQTMLAKNSSIQTTGRIFSWNQSAMYIGNIFGPLVGSTVAGFFNYNVLFIVTAALVGINLLLFHINVVKNIN